MLTPQEVSERAFAKSSFGGYHMAQVDEFLDVLTGDYSALYNENAVLKSKMKVLVDKVEEYRSTEEAMRKALMTAQRMADDMVKEAERKKTEILQEAENTAIRRREELARELAAEEYRLQQAQQSTAEFVNKVKELYSGQVDFLRSLENLCPDGPAPADPVEVAAEEIDDSVQRLLAQAMREATAENLRAQAQEEQEDGLEDTTEFGPIPAQEQEEADREEIPSGRVSRIDFGALQFGRDYEIK